MEALFDIPSTLPNGFRYIPNFLTETEETHLVELVESYSLKPMVFQGYEAKRRVRGFGYNYDFDRRQLLEGEPIPAGFLPLIAKAAMELGIRPRDFVKLLLTEYTPGTVINWHRDAPPFEKIAGISLLSDCRFKLRPYDKQIQTRQAVRSFTVQRRSLYLMEGESRSQWEHSISPVSELRYSITLRTLYQGNGT